MDETDYTVMIISAALLALLGGIFAASSYDAAAQRQCREKLAVAPAAQYRSAADIALICK